MLRRILKKDPKKAFAFELAYQHNLTTQQIAECSSNRYNPDAKAFKINEQEIFLDDYTHSIIENNRNTVLRKVSEASYKLYFKQIGEMLISEGVVDREITWQDIRETRRQNFLKCPECEISFENIPKNWAILKFNDDIIGNHWIVCRTCAEKGGVQ